MLIVRRLGLFGEMPLSCDIAILQRVRPTAKLPGDGLALRDEI